MGFFGNYTLLKHSISNVVNPLAADAIHHPPLRTAAMAPTTNPARSIANIHVGVQPNTHGTILSPGSERSQTVNVLDKLVYPRTLANVLSDISMGTLAKGSVA